MGTFRMAGIESQTVFKILEQFGSRFYSKDNSGKFSDETECYEFAYLLIVLQTQQHNKAIKMKSTLPLFESQANEMVPKSYPNFPPGFAERMFTAITASEIRCPVTRNIRKCVFDLEMFEQEIHHRLVNSTD
jgi:Sec7-like guanine-nucleotide exchange factor